MKVQMNRFTSLPVLGTLGVLALAMAAGSAGAVFVPKACPPGGCEETAAAPSLRKTQPTLFSQGESDFVVASPRARTTFGRAADEGVTVFGAPGGQNRQVFVLRQNSNGDECEVCVEGEEIRVVRNGQPVEARRIQREGNQIRILGDGDEQVMVLRVPEGGASAPQARVIRRGGQAGGQVGGAAPQVHVLRRGGAGAGPQSFQWHMGEAPAAPGAHAFAWRMESGDTPAAPQVRIQRRGDGGQVIERQIQVAPMPGQPGQFRAITVPGGEGGQVRRAIRLHAPDAPTPPAAPEVRIQRRGQGGQVTEHTYEVRPAPGASGTFRAQRVPGPQGMSVMVPQPPARPAAPQAPRAGQGGWQVRVAPQVSGQMVIVGPDGQQRTIELDDLGHGGGHGAGGVREFTLPGGQGRVRVQTAPSGQGGHMIRRGGSVAPAAPAADCCDGSCCENCGNAGGRIVLQQGDGPHQAMTFELGDLGAHLGRMGIDVGDLHQHLMHLEGLEGLHGLMGQIDLGDLEAHGLHMGDLGQEIQVQIESAIAEAMGGIDDHEIRAEVHAELAGAMRDVHEALAEIDWDGISQEVRVEIHSELQDAMEELHRELGGQFMQWHGQHDLAEPSVDVVVEVEDVQAAQPAPQPRRAGQGQAGGGGGQTIRLAPQVRQGQIEVVPQVAEVSRPRVMIGITMGEAPAEVLESLELDADGAIRVERVIAGLPAAEAGLKDGSIIVAIDGHEPATPMLLREVLGDKEPGDTVTLEIVVRGQRKEIEVTLEAYDAEALAAATEEIELHAPEAATTFNWSGEAADGQELSSRIREAVRAMQASGLQEMDQEALREKIDAIVREHFRSMGQGGQGGGYTYMLPRGALVAPPVPDGQGGMVFVQPTTPTPPAPPTSQWRQAGPGVEARLDDLSGRLDRLEARLDRLAELLERRQRD